MHARGLSEANDELVDQRTDLMVQLAHLKMFLSNADKHERQLRVGSCLCMSNTNRRHCHMLFVCCHAHDLHRQHILSLQTVSSLQWWGGMASPASFVS